MATATPSSSSSPSAFPSSFSSSPSYTLLTTTTTTTTLAPSALPTNPNNGNGNGNGTSINGPGDAFSSGLGIQSLLYIIAFISVMMAVFYTIYVTRRDCIRRRRLREGGGNGPQMSERRSPATWRPDSGEEGSPPQYRSYMLDQPFTEPETVAYPDSVYYGNGESSSSEDGTAGLIQRHLAIHDQQQQRDRGELSNDDPQEENSDSAQPILTTTTTITTTTRSITAPSPTLNLSTRGPTTVTTTTTSAAAGSAAAAVEPRSGEESRGTAFLSGRHLSILRRGLKNITHHHHRGENSGDQHSQSSPTEPHSSSSSSSPRNSTVPTVVQMSPILLDDPANASDSNRLEESETRESSEERQSDLMGLPILHRFRSMGPPPYIPLTAGEAPRLPPSYNTIVAETSPAEVSSSTSTSRE